MRHIGAWTLEEIPVPREIRLPDAGLELSNYATLTPVLNRLARQSSAGFRHLAVTALGVWAALTLLSIAVFASHGLTAQYFVGTDWVGPPVRRGVDRSISNTSMSLRWMLTPPPAFSVQWSGYVFIDRPGVYTFATTSDDGSFLHIDGRLVVDNGGEHAALTRDGRIQLDTGPHNVVLQFFQARGSSYSIDWLWGRDPQSLSSVPLWALSTRPQTYAMTLVAWFVGWLWWLSTIIVAGLMLWIAITRIRLTWEATARAAGMVVLAVALGYFYVAGASAHATQINTSKARGDQSAFLWEAELIYQNWHGQNPPFLIGGRNYMPLYGAYQALFWGPWMSDEEFFEIAKVRNIWLSLILLALLGVIFRLHLPPLPALNLTLIVAFGYFIFRAGYTQPELLFYFMFFCAFLAFCYLFESRRNGARLLLGALTGALCALAHLTKAAMLPLVAIGFGVYGIREIATLGRGWLQGAATRRKALAEFIPRAAAGVAAAACFLAVLYPYISNSKRVYGSYFFNVNTTFYIWYNDWPEASVGTRLHHDDEGWPTLPESEIPSMGRYLQTHSIRQIGDRVAGGFADMFWGSYNGFWYLKYVAAYAAFAVALVAAQPGAFMALIDRHRATASFIALYAVVYLVATAFYAPISGTGTIRFLLTHVAPFMFVLSCFFVRQPFSDTTWRIGGTTVTARHVHLFVTITVALDLVFVLWPRLMTTYGGF
jgi:hypothetical protein